MVVVVVAACAQVAGSRGEGPEAPPSARVPDGAAADETAATKPYQEPTFEAPPSEDVLAYIDDCAHRFTVVDEEFGDPDNPDTECDYIEFNQNCEYDPSGCWDEGEGCIRGCRPACNTCQDQCIGSCGQCRAACPEGSAGCIRQCAEARQACREGCLEALSTCQGTECSAAEEECYAEFNDQRERMCPECAEISDCYQQDHGDLDYEEVCIPRFPDADKKCFEWCYDYYE